MIQIRNLQFQPLTFNLAGTGTLHLGPRERKSIARQNMSLEIQAAGKRGWVEITELAESSPVAPVPTPASDVTADATTPAADEPVIQPEPEGLEPVGDEGVSSSSKRKK